MQFDLRILQSVTSTNDVVKQAIDEGAPEGIAVRAFVQTGGYGRQGRTWSSPQGGCYQSVLLRPDCASEQLPTLGLVAALAVRRAICDFLGSGQNTVKVKWPNDVMAADGKLVGISCETHAGAVCIGIGVNVLPPVQPNDVGGKNEPAYLADFMPPGECSMHTIDELGDIVLRTLAHYYDIWCVEGFGAFEHEYGECNYLSGRLVQLVLLGGDILAEGQVQGVDERGMLLLRDGQTVRSYSSGEAHIIGVS